MSSAVGVASFGQSSGRHPLGSASPGVDDGMLDRVLGVGDPGDEEVDVEADADGAGAGLDGSSEEMSEHPLVTASTSTANGTLHRTIRETSRRSTRAPRRSIIGRT
ncbi:MULTISPECIES: hypothetical protein [Gordonia]|uniref:hypothetical protein n=1 Tax=Gordonia TaxID=2053 RepID=UPI0004670D9C|nr:MULTISPECIES: hypothetical protein [Gordonia]ATD70362.1 hypothetical protein CNO18_08825 [Gordonia sp. 1D]MCZ4577998.1 hypothetical protein [Gordonia amicalis]UPW13984.1 hypothetical protein M0655_22785 [Gordonia amicalis]